MNKQGEVGKMALGLIFAAMLFIIGGGIWAGVAIFYGAEYDFKKADAQTLNQIISECIQTQNFEITEQNLFSECNLNKKVIKENFVLKIEKNSEEIYNQGGDKVACGFGEKNPQFPRCTDNIFSIGQDNYYILTGSSQQIRREFK